MCRQAGNSMIFKSKPQHGKVVPNDSENASLCYKQTVKAKQNGIKPLSKECGRNQESINFLPISPPKLDQT